MTSPGEIPLSGDNTTDNTVRFESFESLETASYNHASLFEGFESIESLDAKDSRTISRVRDKTTWKLDFNAEHCFEPESGKYTGREYKFRLQCLVPINGVPEEMSLAIQNDVDQAVVPRSEITDIHVAHDATYVLSRYGTLGWNILRSYEFCYPDEEDAHDDTPGKTMVEDECFVVIDHHIPEKVPIDEPLDPFAAIEAGLHIETAGEIFAAMLERRIPRLDFVRLFPAEVVKEIDTRS